ncbi:MAG TPA: GNAT family N-acetyltransferase [Stenomitos sp.]
MDLQVQNINYRAMSLEYDNPMEVASLIYESAPELFNLMFSSQAISCLAKLVQRSYNRFSSQYIRVAEIGDQIVGIITFVPAAYVNANAGYFDILNFVQKFWLSLIQRCVLSHVVQQVYPSESFYVGNLAVAAEYRNQGIGRQLLSWCIAEAACTSSPIFISVDLRNIKARRLYESLGFRMVGMKRMRLFGTTIGSCILSISENL